MNRVIGVYLWTARSLKYMQLPNGMYWSAYCPQYKVKESAGTSRYSWIQSNTINIGEYSSRYTK